MMAGITAATTAEDDSQKSTQSRTHISEVAELAGLSDNPVEIMLNNNMPTRASSPSKRIFSKI